MRRKKLLKRIIALTLTAVMMAMSGFYLEEVRAEPIEDYSSQEQIELKQQESGADTDDSSTEEPTADSEDPSSDNPIADPEDPTLNGDNPQSQDEEDPEATISPIKIMVAGNSDGIVKLTWEPVEGADGYTIIKEPHAAYKKSLILDEGTRVFNTKKPEYTFKKLFPGRKYSFMVTAYDEYGNVITKTSKPKKVQPIITPRKTKPRKNRTVEAKRKKVNKKTDLRKLIGESHNGYSVMQGGCTDGKYNYYLMVSAYNQHGRIVKVSRKKKKVVKVSGVLNIWHGNGMAYDSRRKQLVVNARSEAAYDVYRKQELTCIDPVSLKIIKDRQKKIKYSYFADDYSYFAEYERTRGLANVAYNEKYDVYICMQRTNHNLIIVDPDTFQTIGMVITAINYKYPGTYQDMDCDDQYVFQLLSEDGDRQPYNLILAFDWNAEQMIDEEGHRRKYVPEVWNCLNRKKPVAVYRIRSPHEAENIFHTTDAAGNTHFYLGEYDANYKAVKKASKKKVKVKVKWKKVKKKVKVKVKWKKVKKKVKVKGKWKTKRVWKYKYKTKTKKVWKYKTKYKKKYYTVYRRDRRAHVYDLGII